MTETSDRALKIPNVTRLCGFLIIGLVLYGAARTPFVSGEPPLLLPLIAALLSVAFLLGANVGKDPVTSLARLGFHVGLFVYFISFPLLSPENMDAGFSDGVHQTLGWMLILSVLGFEGAYHSLRLIWRARSTPSFPAGINSIQRRFLALFLCLGLAAWFTATVDYSTAARVSILDLVLSMRGGVEGALENPVTELGLWAYVLISGLYLAVAAAFLLLTCKRRPSLKTHFVCWSAMALCAVLGFLSGSRALFLYSFAPLVLASWIQLMRFGLGKVIRVLLAVWVICVLVTVWLAMSAIRSQGVIKYEATMANITPVEYARGAFDMYSSSALIVQAFPNDIDYEYGKSLIPLFLGWVPRSMWPDKPYPFSIYANTVRGETLEDRSASIAVGLPGEGYGNFGLFGVLLWAALMGLACRCADEFLRRFDPSNPLRLLLGASMCIWAAMIVRGGVPEMFYMGLQVNMFPIALSLFLKLMARRSPDAILIRPGTSPIRSLRV